MKLSTIMKISVLKLHVGHKRHGSKIVEMIEMNENNVNVQHGCKDHEIKIKNENKPSKSIWSDKIGEILAKRNIEIE